MSQHDDDARAMMRFGIGTMGLDPNDVAPEVADLCGLEDDESYELALEVLREVQEREVQADHDATIYSHAVVNNETGTAP
jgi:hypothetical protein